MKKITKTDIKDLLNLDKFEFEEQFGEDKKNEIITLIKDTKEYKKHLNALRKHIDNANEINNEWFLVFIDLLLDYFVSVNKVSQCSNIHFSIIDNTLCFAINFFSVFIDFEKNNISNQQPNFVRSLKNKIEDYFIIEDVLAYKNMNFRFLHSNQFSEFKDNSQKYEFEIRKIV